MRGWILAAVAGLAVLLVASYCSYSEGRDHERGRVRDSLVAIDELRDRALQVERAKAAAELAAGAQRTAALERTNREMTARLAATRTAVAIADSTHVVIHNTTIVEVPAEVVERIRVADSTITAKDELLVDRDSTIARRVRLTRIDSSTIANLRGEVAHLKIPPPRPPFLDRLIARAAVPAVKGAVIAGIGYGLWTAASRAIARRK